MTIDPALIVAFIEALFAVIEECKKNRSDEEVVAALRRPTRLQKIRAVRKADVSFRDRPKLLVWVLTHPELTEEEAQELVTLQSNTALA